MSTISLPYTFSSGATIIAAEHNDNFTTIYNDYNGSINNSNIASNAAIAGSKISADFGAQNITTTGNGSFADINASDDVFVSGTVEIGGDLEVTGTTEITGQVDFSDAIVASGAVSIGGTAASPPLINTIYKENIVKGWISLDGSGTAAVKDSFNVTSITDNGTGDYTITWNTDFANATYAISALAIESSSDVRECYFTAKATGTCAIQVNNSGDSASDTDELCVIAIGDQ